MKTTTWGSRNAEDLFRVAHLLANFDPKELMKEICRIQKDKSRQVNETTVLNAMQNVKDYYDAGNKPPYDPS